MEVQNAQIRLMVADDHPVVRLGLKSMLQTESSFSVVGEACDGKEAIEVARRLKPDILVLDLAMPRIAGMEVLRELTTVDNSIRVIVLTGTIDKQQLVDSLRLGARGIVLKDSAADDLVHAIHTVHNGQYWIGQRGVGDLVGALQQALTDKPAKTSFGLTSRELQIVRAVAEGDTNKGIGQRFSIAEDTVKSHLSHIFDKLGVSSRLELGLFAINHHLSSND